MEDYLGTALERFKVDLDLLRERDKNITWCSWKHSWFRARKYKSLGKTLQWRFNYWWRWYI